MRILSAHRALRSLAAVAIGACTMVIAPTGQHAYAAAPIATLVSVALDGGESNGPSGGVALNGDGTLIAFHSEATNLVAGDTNNARDAFVRDFTNNTTERVSLTNTGTQTDGDSDVVAISSNGRYVLFTSRATNLGPDPVPGSGGAFVHDRTTHTTTLVSDTNQARLAVDANIIAFVDSTGHAALLDLASGIVSNVNTGCARGWSGTTLGISGDGRYSTWQFIPCNDNERQAIEYDRVADASTLILSFGSGSFDPGSRLSDVAYSGDGAIRSFSTKHVHKPFYDVNWTTSTIRRGAPDQTDTFCSIPHWEGGIQDGLQQPLQVHNLTTNGRYAIATSNAAFICDTTTHEVLLASAGLNGGYPSSASSPITSAAISGSGATVAFASDSSDIVTGDTNGTFDIFVTDRLGLQNPPRRPSGSFENQHVQEPTVNTFTELAVVVRFDSPLPFDDTLLASGIAGSFGTAENFVDYMLVSWQAMVVRAEIAVPAGATSAVLRVRIAGDAITEPAETIVVKLSSAWADFENPILTITIDDTPVAATSTTTLTPTSDPSSTVSAENVTTTTYGGLGTLPATGSNTPWLSALAMLLISAGALTIGVSRRRQSTSTRS